jgi:hypothetical protein
VIEALRGNDVPEELLSAVRRVPLPERAVAGLAGGEPGRAADDAEAALRLAYHEPVLERGLRTMAETGPAWAGRIGLAGALLGARDGIRAVPGHWLPPESRDAWSDLAARVVRPLSASPVPSA